MTNWTCPFIASYPHVNAAVVGLMCHLSALEDVSMALQLIIKQLMHCACRVRQRRL